jgi:hypothetical protein
MNPVASADSVTVAAPANERFLYAGENRMENHDSRRWLPCNYDGMPAWPLGRVEIEARSARSRQKRRDF